MIQKLILLTAFISSLSLSACSKVGGTFTFTANTISTIPVKEYQTFTHKGHEFIYYNVYNDGNGNFIMADNSSFIANNDIQFGLKVKSPYVYKYSDEGTEELLSYTSIDEDGCYNYSVVDTGFIIYGVDREISTPYENINIGQITHWC